MSAAPDSTSLRTVGLENFETLLEIAVGAVIEVSKTMQNISLDPAGPAFDFDRQGLSTLDCGSCISVTCGDRTWNIALFGSLSSCRVLARSLLGMDAEEDLGFAELADALGEILNMVAGVSKRRIPPEESKTFVLGLSLFMTGTDCFRYLAKGVQVKCQRLVGPDVDVDVIIVWKEG